MIEAWQFVLAHRARLPDTVDFVLYDLFSIFAYICAQGSAVEYRHLISGTRCSKYGRLWGQMLEKMELFRRIVVFRVWIHRGNCEWKWRILRLIAHLVKKGMLLCG